MRRIITTVFALYLLLVVLAGCSAQASGPDSTTDKGVSSACYDCCQ